MRVLATVVAVLLACIATAQAAPTSVRLGGMDVVVWTPPFDTGAPQPMVVFSHGFHGCATQSRFLMEAFASAGYLVFAPNHRDAWCRGGSASWTQKNAIAFRDVGRWNESSYRDRADDIRRLVEAIRIDEHYRKRADLSRLALVGHSLGGYAVLGLAGAWPSWKMGEVRAVIALSPYSQPFAAHGTLGGLSAPVMYQSGTWDFGVKPTMHRTLGSYDQSPSPKYYVEFDRATHFAWTNLGLASAHANIVAYCVAFLNHYVRSEPPDPLLTQSSKGVAMLHYASELGNH